MRFSPRRCVVVDRWDRERYAGTLDLMPEFGAEGAALADTVGDGGGELWADTFAAFDRVAPELVDVATLEAAVVVNHAVLAQAFHLPEFAQLRVWSRGDAVASALACISVRGALERIHDRVRTFDRRAQALAQKRAEVMARLSAGDPVQDLLADLEAEEESLALEEPQAALMLRPALSRAADEAERSAAMVAAWAPGHDPARMPAEQRLALARRLKDPRFEAMADLFGSLQAMLAAQVRLRPSPLTEDSADLTYGRDLARVLPSSLMHLADDDMAPRFYADYLNGRLPQTGSVTPERLGRGGIVCCIDNSVSMQGRPEEFAKAVGLVLLDLCRRQGRRFYAIHFSGTDQMIEWDFTGSYGVDQVVDFAEHFFRGFTDFVPPMRRARELLRAEHTATGRIGADIVMVTDGEVVVPPSEVRAHVAELEAMGAATWGILIGGESRMEPLRTLCAGRVAKIADILDPRRPLADLWTGVA